MRVYYFLIIFLVSGCSFDNKSGIWNNENTISTNSKKVQGEFVKLNELLKIEIFNKTIDLKNEFKFNLSPPIKNFEWRDYFYKNSNNFDNFKYSKLDNEIFKSKKLSRKKSEEFAIFENNKFIFSNQEGDIILFSISENRILNKFNFYKKKYKNLKKKLNLVIENNIIYVSDNLGYLYAYDSKLNKILWAKNYKIPFRSNMKVDNNNIYTSNQNNDFLIIEKNSGEVLKKIPTEENNIQNVFINNIALDEKNFLFFLNSYGSLYSIDTNTLQVRWFINLNQSLNSNYLNNFLSSEIVYQKKKIIISTNYYTYIINSENGFIISKLNFSSKVKPIIHNNYLFLVTKNNFLIAFDLINLKILYSYNIDDQVAKNLKIKKKKISLKDLLLVNDDLLILLNNSYILYFNIRGKLKVIKKLNASMNTKPIFVDNALLYLDNNNKLRILN